MALTKIQTAGITDDAIDSDQYVDGSIDNAHLAANSVDSDQYVDGSIDTVHLADYIVTSIKIGVGHVDTQCLATGAVETDKIEDLNVTTAKIADDAVTAAKIASGVLQNSNILINGNFDIWQRGTSFTNTANIYTADRWFLAGSGAVSCTRQSGTSSDAFQYYYRAQRYAGATHTGVNLGYALELSDVIALRGKTLTFSCKLRKGANYSPTADAIAMSCGSNNDAADQNKSQNYVDGIASETKTLTSSWQTFSVSHTVEADAVALIVRLRATTTGTAGADDYFDLAQAKMELGSVATPFEPKSFGQELRDCQRYYEKSYSQGVALGTNTNVGAYRPRHPTTGTNGSPISFVTSKRTTPTIVFYSRNTGATGKITNMSGGASDIACSTEGYAGEWNTVANYTSTGSETNCEGHWTAEAEL